MYLLNDEITEDDVDALFEKCCQAEGAGTTQYRAMTYEDGIKATLQWLLEMGYDQDHPLDE